MSIYIVQDIANRPVFFVKISVVFLGRTKPASSIENPAAIHITKVPIINKYRVFRENCVSSIVFSTIASSKLKITILSFKVYSHCINESYEATQP